ncbi:HK97 family phage prohead protease [Rhodobacteraceae bacterium RKSG542]|uniref:HK97 family phage prohead protease n=1 Tax=Pseudovibrio flavus TaxID=2529854 RepID=UPI0012BCAF14|nr:HK97 family phage prohead protease [Pseudovibrio flavus]MTI17063.1 HK97 family phage prohead protease [Pseudovibrio flavus]
MVPADAQPLLIEGYASRFDEVDDGGDRLQRGAFLRSLMSKPVKDIKMLWQHDPAKPIGRWLEVAEDATGLFVKGVLLPSLLQGQEACVLVRSGILDGLSIGFKTRRSKRSQRSGVREVQAVDLWEISLVTFPLLTSARLNTVPE